MKNSKGKRGKYARRRKVSTTKLLLVITVIAVIVALLLCFAARDNLRPAETTVPTEEGIIAPATDVTLVTETQAETAAEASEPVAATSAATEPPAETENVQPTESNENKPKPADKETEDPYLDFPYSIPGTTLVIQKVDSYDGIFLEDGSDRSVEGIYAMVLKNTGDVGVEYANITLIQNGQELQFKATALPAGATMVVQEVSAAAYSGSEFTDCTCEVALLENFEMSENMVSVTENEEGRLVVTNLAEDTIPCIRIFYKFHMSDEDVYVGGITYTAKVTELEGGESCVISPSHYATGSSALVMVRTYETAD